MIVATLPFALLSPTTLTLDVCLHAMVAFYNALCCQHLGVLFKLNAYNLYVLLWNTDVLT